MPGAQAWQPQPAAAPWRPVPRWQGLRASAAVLAANKRRGSLMSPHEAREGGAPMPST